jgi:solute:Na+ symporter, SSS family
MSQSLPLAVLTRLDWSLIILYFVVALALAMLFARRASKSTGEFFTSGKSAPWWLAGISMVATTFAADTPLAVTGLVAEGGVIANWFWWSLAMSVMATVFIYSKLWRRSGVMTDVEFAEIRYSGPPAAFLRGFRALYLGLLMNGIILGWVTLGMKIVIRILLQTDLDDGGQMTQWLLSNFGWAIAWIPRAADAGVMGPEDAAWAVIIVLYVITGLYAMLAGLWGVMVVDLYQFVIAIGMAIVLAVFAINSVGGFEGLQSELQERYGPEAEYYTNVLPRPTPPPEYSPEALEVLGWDEAPSPLMSQFIEPAFPEDSDVSMPITGGVGSTLLFTFLVFIGVQWWSVWYPGHEPGGGGYIAQRILSAKNEKHSLFATLLFSICHFALRPWPWVIVGLVALIKYQGHPLFEEKADNGYALAMFEFLRPGLLGLMLVSFLAAFMSTISTQLNWGSSYIVNDFYQRFIARGASQRHLVFVSRLATVALVIIGIVVSSYMTTVAKAWLLVMGLGAGTGLVYMLRWFWWRINAWTEIAAMASSLIVWVGLDRLNEHVFGPKLHWNLNTPSCFLITIAISTVVWLTVTFVTRPTDRETLKAFYRTARPGGPGWKRIAREETKVTIGDSLRTDIANWIMGCVMIYGVLFGTWKLMLGQTSLAAILLAAAVLSVIIIVGNMVRRGFDTFSQ